MIVGTNLIPVDWYSAAQPFVNIFKTGGSWTPAAGTAPDFTASLDADGYPDATALSNGGGSCNTLVLSSLSSNFNPVYYRSGRYVWLYDGTGTFTFSSDFTVVTETAQDGTPGTGRILLDAVPTMNGTRIALTSTGAGAGYAKNFRLVYADTAQGGVQATSTIIHPNETAATAANAGDLTQAFNPDFIDRVSFAKCFRFMDWLSTNMSQQQNWTDRPTTNWVFWNDDLKFNGGFEKGRIVPIELCVALCNKVGADAWFNMPALATNDYVTQFATLVYGSLDSSRKVYTEYWNEVWNPGGHGNGLEASVSALGATQFPGLTDDFDRRYIYGAYRAVTFGKIWKTAFGASSSRVVTMVAEQSASSSRLDDFIAIMTADKYSAIDPTAWTGLLANNVDAFSFAPYMQATPSCIPAAWTDTAVCADGGLTNLFTVVNGPQSLIPDGTSGTIATAVGGGALGAGWSDIQVAAGPGTLVNGTIISVTVQQAGAAGALTLKANDGTAYPIQDPDGVAVTAGFNAQTINFVWTNKTSDGVVATPGWRYQVNIASGGTMSEAEGWTVNNKASCDTYGLQMLCYECGQQFSAGNNNPPLDQLFYEANNDARMGTAYTTYFTMLKNAGFLIANHYSDIGKYTGFGYWGLVDNVTVTSSPKYDALTAFAATSSYHRVRLTVS